jgi:DNA excision repair protein ERCC-4
MLVSPAEPRELREIGNVSSSPERHGCDFLFFGKHIGMVGVQRKEINDLIASLRDDRLTREIPLLQKLDVGILLIEGRIEWTNDGFLLATSSQFTKAQYRGILWSLQSAGLWTSFTDSLTETITYLLSLSRWIAKDRHTGLLARSTKASVKSEYGTKDDRAWQIFVMQSFPGVGYEKAKAIVDHFGGLPLAWTGRLDEVDGIGEVTAARLGRLLTPPEANPAGYLKSGSGGTVGESEAYGGGAG